LGLKDIDKKAYTILESGAYFSSRRIIDKKVFLRYILKNYGTPM
jgi:hypothetical protein